MMEKESKLTEAMTYYEKSGDCYKAQVCDCMFEYVTVCMC